MAAYHDLRGNSHNLLNSNDLHLRELLATDKYRATEKLLRNGIFHHFSPKSPGDSAPCKNGAVCVPEYQWNSYRYCKFDFEDGISRWIRTGKVFNNQPTYGDNPTFRGRESAIQQGNWWIGGYENRPSPGATAGTAQGDGPLGTLTTPLFHIEGRQASHCLDVKLLLIRTVLSVFQNIKGLSPITVTVSLEPVELTANEGEIKPAVKNKLCNLPSGSYVIDPDGEGGEKPFEAYCDMTNKNGVGVTVVSHDSENRT
ncbi:hypothetical protein AWC38_SpisGene2057 [Stylophora pistillata]|uniref:Fibrinogen C-terminal domain-containing protein n=1 Tax=Stylophora pistillata TaxID=50429 RepID=A0A2B4SVC9_STYPI|nr:hypothetical protein AWC38_SpisGene2057 [Stylophora pistillata]